MAIRTETTNIAAGVLAVLVMTTLPNLVAASGISYQTQDRSVWAQAAYAFPDPFTEWAPGPPTVASDFSAFDELATSSTWSATGAGHESYARASHFSELAADSITVDLSAYASNQNYDSGRAEARSIFDVSFSLAETTSFFVTGWLASDARFGPQTTFRIADVLLEDSVGTEISLDWQGGSVSQQLDSQITLSAGSYRLRVESATDVRCQEWPNECVDFSASNRMDAEFSMSVVPVPPALLLFPSALAVLGWSRRAARAT